MASQDITLPEKLRRFLYTNTHHGAFISGNPDKHHCQFSDVLVFRWVKTSHEEFIKILHSVNDDPLLIRRENLFYIMAGALQYRDLSSEIKEAIKDSVMKLVKSDEDFFNFIRYYTLAGSRKSKITTTLRKMIRKFYNNKEPDQLAESVTHQESYHGWTHKNLIKLCHFKCDKIYSEPVFKYVLFGVKSLPEKHDANNKILDLLKKSHELRTTEDDGRAVALIKELHAGVAQVNSKLNKNEQVWVAAIPEMTTREVLQCLYRLYKFGFMRSGCEVHAQVIKALTNVDKIMNSNLHPIEVFIYLKFFEKGGKAMDPKLIEHLQRKEVPEETLKKLTTPSEPKCKEITQNVNKCLMLSYNNVEPTGKRFMITIDVTEKAEEYCFQNKRISCLEAAVAIIRYLSKVEKSVTVAVFKDDSINFVEISKSPSAIEKLQEHKAAYILPNAPIDHACNKKKSVDVFINFMSCNWLSSVPLQFREQVNLSEALKKYSRKMNAPDTKVVKIFLGGATAAFTNNSRNILSIAGFSVEVPRILEAFCRGRFC